jgi:condensin complex subunit 3
MFYREEIYESLRAALLQRIYDKETTVRVQAVISLAKLSGTEDPADLAGEPSVIDVLIETLTYDPAAYVSCLSSLLHTNNAPIREVRRATLLNMPVTASTLVPILARTRDTDTTIRKLVYSSVLDPTNHRGEAVGIIHPRALTIAQRELIVRNGLGDRESVVRAAAAKLVTAWVEALSEDGAEDEKKPGNANAKTVEEDMVALLKMFDLTENSVAGDALLSVFTTRVDIFDGLQFGGKFLGM